MMNTSWFDLNRYAELKELDLLGWHRQISERSYVYNDRSLSHYPDLSPEAASKFQSIRESQREEWMSRVKEKPILHGDYGRLFEVCRADIGQYPFDTCSVRSLKASACLNVGDDVKEFPGVLEACEADSNAYDRAATVEEIMTANTPINLLYSEHGFSTDGLALLEVNLNSSDARIIQDFRHWLQSYRAHTGTPEPVKNFNETHLKNWYDWRIIPYLDLTMTAKIEGETLTYPQVARLLFPDEYDVDIVGRVRRTTRPKAEWMMKESTVLAIEAELIAHPA